MILDHWALPGELGYRPHPYDFLEPRRPVRLRWLLPAIMGWYYFLTMVVGNQF